MGEGGETKPKDFILHALSTLILRLSKDVSLKTDLLSIMTILKEDTRETTVYNESLITFPHKTNQLTLSSSLLW